MIKNICASVKGTKKNYLWSEMKNLEVLFSQHSLSNWTPVTKITQVITYQAPNFFMFQFSSIIEDMTTELKYPQHHTKCYYSLSALWVKLI